ncbi:hypothetical protein FRB90_000383 [Tulasnella sp. 427]|nr:hypothetical protein FRB90_000383 [Tulasnella sp. 427]
MQTPAAMKDQQDLFTDFESLVLERNPFNINGGFGDVYKAQHPQWGFLALKRPRGMGDPGSPNYRHLLHEAALWKAARHPNVLRFLGTWEANNTVYLISTFLDNGTVMQYLIAHPNADRTKFVGAYSRTDVAWLTNADLQILDVAKGLAYLHEIDIVHGDIKGGNILISASVDAVLADFGLAKLADTSTTTLLKGAGSLRYQSPEILREGAHKTPASDVYSFGITIYEILSGTIPFEGVSNFGVMTMVMFDKKRPEEKPKMSPLGDSYEMQWRAARRCWDDNPSIRPSTKFIVRWLDSEGIIRGRIRILCDQKPKLNGYISRVEGGFDVVTADSSNARKVDVSLRGSYPKWLCKLKQVFPYCPYDDRTSQSPVMRVPPTVVRANLASTDMTGQELYRSIHKAMSWGMRIETSTTVANAWITSCDWDIECTASLLPFAGCSSQRSEKRLEPALFTAVCPCPMIFFSHFDETDDLLKVRMVFEEIPDGRAFLPNLS